MRTRNRRRRRRLQRGAYEDEVCKGVSTTESLVPCIIDPDSLWLPSPRTSSAAVFRSVSFLLRDSPPVGLLPPRREYRVPAYLYQPESYLPTRDSPSNHLRTTSPRVGCKKPPAGCLALRGVEIDRSIARLTWGRWSVAVWPRSSTVTLSLFLSLTHSGC